MDQDDEYILTNNERPKNPGEKSNIISKILFWYTLKTFILGFKNKLTEGNLYKTLEVDRSFILGNRLDKFWRKELKKDKPHLTIALIRTFIWDFIWFVAIAVLLQCVRISQPILIYYILLGFLPESTYSHKDSVMFTGILIVTAFVNVLTVHSYLFGLQHLGMQVRVAASSLVYRKCLKLSNKALEESNIGHIVNLLSNDVNRFDFLVTNLPYVIIGAVDIFATIYVMYIYMGISSIIGSSVILVMIPFQILVATKFIKIRNKTAAKTDERVQIMNEIVCGIKVIKMYNWEIPFIKYVANTRRLEIRQILSGCNIKAILLSLVLILARLALFISIAAFVCIGSIPSAAGIYFLVGLLNVMRYTQTQMLPNSIFGIVETKVSIQRLQKFLLHNEKVEFNQVSDRNNDLKINIVKANAKWAEFMPENTLIDINLEVNNELVAVIGSVGSGKSSLLNLILKELSVTSGSVEVNGNCSYASQEPWLFDGNLRQNILFGQAFDQNKYNEVVRVCSLRRDFSLLPFGDQTQIGDRGSILSGGQRARVNLARAIYKEADIYLLDDPLSAVDSNVSRRIFEDCIINYLKGKCIILVTHQVQFLQKVSTIVMLRNGILLFKGDFNVLKTEAPDFVKTLEDAEDEEKDIKFVDDRVAPPPPPPKKNEFRETGAVKGRVYTAYMNAGGNIYHNLLLITLFLASQSLVSLSDYFITIWVNVEQERNKKADDKRNNAYATYFYITVYAVIIILTVIITIWRSLYFFNYCMRASVTIHDRMFKSVIMAPMSFFNNNPAGRILNRFAKDMGNIDEQFPMVTMDTIQIGLQVVGIIIVTIILNPIFTIGVVILLVLFYLIRIFYLRTSRVIKRLEGTTKSPVFTHVNSTLFGLSTIRAYGAEELMLRKYDAYQDVHNTTWQLFISTSRAFSFSLEFICFCYIIFISFGLILFKNERFGGNIGLGITQSLSLSGMFQWGMRQWTEMENCMTSVERIYEYTNIEAEKSDLLPIEPPPTWPEYGMIEFIDVFLRYSLEEDFVLKQLTFKVNPGEKVGIVGRTGAGKTSLISSMFQLAYTSGEILVDNIDIRTVPLPILRSNISIIPQEPVLFAGTLRMNLDPFENYNDKQIWEALEQVELKYTIMETPLGLSSHVTEGGTNYSVGQRQLMCLARAIIRHTKILILDEATANVDPYTDYLIQKTMRIQFKNCTVLTIAHRLDTIMDSDKVLVLDAGELQEFDHPNVLLKNKNGMFYGLVQQAGSYGKFSSRHESLADAIRESSKAMLSDEFKDVLFKEASRSNM